MATLAKNSCIFLVAERKDAGIEGGTAYLSRSRAEDFAREQSRTGKKYRVYKVMTDITARQQESSFKNGNMVWQRTDF